MRTIVDKAAPPISAAKLPPATATARDRPALAFGTCVRAIENTAKYDLRWTSWGKFHSADGIVHPDGKILFSGDQAEAQNGFGGWVRVRYFCVFDPRTKQAEVSIEQGRFPK